MKLSSHGAAEMVTGSCHLIETEEAKVLIDCGLFQGHRAWEKRNKDDFGFNPREIDAVVLTHAHLDHSGRLPELIDQGFEGKIHCTFPTKELVRLVLKDAFYLMSERAERNNEEMYFQKDDVERVFDNSIGHRYHEVFEPAPGIEIEYFDAGHILGASTVALRAEGKTVHFSGDLGNLKVPILHESEPIPTADVVVVESTYGDRLHEPTKERVKKLRQNILDTIKKRGVLMIPAFSLERTQEILFEMNHLFEHEKLQNIPVFLDSPLAIKATNVYQEYSDEYLSFDQADEIIDEDLLNFPNLEMTKLTEASKHINDVPAPKVIIAGSGMMNGGRILHHLMRYLPDPKSTLLIIGHQAEHTLGRRLYEGAKTVKIHGKQVKVKAKVKAIGAYSAHADQKKLTQWVQPKGGKMPKIHIVHGDKAVQEIFATHLRHNLKTEVVINKYQQEYEI